MVTLVKWTVQKNAFYTFLSFIKANKYPPSLLYILMTLGPACLFLAFTEKMNGAVCKNCFCIWTGADVILLPGSYLRHSF
jgi:uncharacterized membrane protein